MHSENTKDCWYQYLTDTAGDPQNTGTATGTESHGTTPVAGISGGTHDSTAPEPRSPEIPFGEPYTLWDAERGRIIRHINVSWLDVNAHSENGLRDFLTQAKATHVQEFVIHDNRPQCGNPAYSSFSKRTLASFLTTMRDNGFICRLA